MQAVTTAENRWGNPDRPENVPETDVSRISATISTAVDKMSSFEELSSGYYYFVFRKFIQRSSIASIVFGIIAFAGGFRIEQAVRIGGDKYWTYYVEYGKYPLVCLGIFLVLQGIYIYYAKPSSKVMFLESVAVLGVAAWNIYSSYSEWSAPGPLSASGFATGWLGAYQIFYAIKIIRTANRYSNAIIQKQPEETVKEVLELVQQVKDANVSTEQDIIEFKTSDGEWKGRLFDVWALLVCKNKDALLVRKNDVSCTVDNEILLGNYKITGKVDGLANSRLCEWKKKL